MIKKVIFIIFSTVFSISCTNKPDNKGESSLPIKAIKVRTNNNETFHKYTFISKPFRHTELSFKVSGQITDFNIQNGQSFRKGELIAAIDNRDFIIQKDYAEANLMQKESEWKRASNLYKNRNISEMSLIKSKAEYLQAKANYQDALNKLEDTRIYAPFDGFVQKTNIDKYQEVKASSPILTLIDLSKIKIETYVPEYVAFKINNIDKSDIKVHFKSVRNKHYTPSEVYINKSTSENNISYMMTIILNNNDKKLLGGMSGDVYIKEKDNPTVSSIAVIPQHTICHNETTGDYVWKIDKEQKVCRTKVTVGNLLENNNIEILEGIKDGDIIAASRLYSLKESEKVEITME